MLVQKFGGTSVADTAGFQACGEVVRRHAVEDPVIVVLSAVKGVTDLLLAAIDAAAQDQDIDVPLEQIIGLESAVVEGLGAAGMDTAQADRDLENRVKRLRTRLEGIRLLGSCPDTARAEILASGERFSSRLMALYLRHLGLEARWSDADVLPPASDKILDTLLDQEAAESLLREALENTRVLGLPGFYSRNESGCYQLLGRNVSDYTAAAV